MSKQDDNEFLTKRKQLAHQLLREIVEFAEFEKWQVPYEFLTTMEGLAAIVNKPDFLLFHDENGRWQIPEESTEYQKRLYAVWEIAMMESGPSVDGDEVTARYCPHCERIILSSKAILCLWCGERLPGSSNNNA